MRSSESISPVTSIKTSPAELLRINPAEDLESLWPIWRETSLTVSPIEANRAGTSRDIKAAAAVVFAKALNTHLGEVTQAEFDAVREAGYSDGEIVEIVTHVGMNILTNLIGKATRVEIDVELPQEKVLHLRITDNGIGFDEIVVQAGEGLKNMRSRVAEIGGTLSLISQPGQGTTVDLVVELS